EDLCVCGSGESCFLKEGAEYGACFADVDQCKTSVKNGEVFEDWCTDQGSTGCDGAWLCQTIEQYNAILTTPPNNAGDTPALDLNVQVECDGCGPDAAGLDCYNACGTWHYLNDCGECDGSVCSRQPHREGDLTACSASAPAGSPNKYIGGCCFYEKDVGIRGPTGGDLQTGCDHLRSVQDATGLA
ncbi:unnamed protein product, partial [Amoebophrya sp. A120]